MWVDLHFKMEDVPKLLGFTSIRAQRHLGTRVGQGNETLLEGGLLTAVTSVTRRRSAKRFACFRSIVAFGSAFPLVKHCKFAIKKRAAWQTTGSPPSKSPSCHKSHSRFAPQRSANVASPHVS